MKQQYTKSVYSLNKTGSVEGDGHVLVVRRARHVVLHGHRPEHPPGIIERQTWPTIEIQTRVHVVDERTIHERERRRVVERVHLREAVLGKTGPLILPEGKVRAL
jgi:hypothetical protein